MDEFILQEPYMVVNDHAGNPGQFLIRLSAKDHQGQEHSRQYLCKDIYCDPIILEVAKEKFCEHIKSGKCSGCKN